MGPWRGSGQVSWRPAEVTSFVDRARELDALLDLILRPETRLATLTGPGYEYIVTGGSSLAEMRSTSATPSA